MKNETQLARYQKLVQFLETRFKSPVSTDDIEDIAHYSYRNINRIFLALQHETIGQFIKRKRLEKAAEYLKYSEHEISDIALEIGYSDVAAFSKAFKKHFRSSPSNFRRSATLQLNITKELLHIPVAPTEPQLNFELETLPEFTILYLPYQGSYENIAAIEKTWNQLLTFAHRQQLLDENSIPIAEILDDDEISDAIHCRYHAGLIIDPAQAVTTKGHFALKVHRPQKYAKFVHKGSHESCCETYERIYACWLTEVALEFADAPILEFYLNDEEDTPQEELLTEIYIPVE